MTIQQGHFQIACHQLNTAIYATGKKKEKNEGREKKTKKKNEVEIDHGHRYRGNQVEIVRPVHTAAATDTGRLQPAAIIDCHLFRLYLI